jgi:small subunit ribosomal protein S1
MAEQTQVLEIGVQVSGRVRRLGIYGALVDIGTGQDALLHVSQLAQGEERNFEDVAQEGAKIEAYVYKTRGDGYIALTMEKPPSVRWQTIKQGNRYTGEVIRIEDFGVFVDFGAERPGMVHVSEMSDEYVKSPSDVASVGQEVEVRVIKKNGRPRQIDLTMKTAEEEPEPMDDIGEEEDVPTSMAQAFRRAMQGAEGKATREESQNSTVDDHRSRQDELLERTLRGSGT